MKSENDLSFKAAVVDIETSSLAAVGFGQIIMACILPLGSNKVTVLRADELNCRIGNEKRLVKMLIAELSKYHLLIGHNANRFDWNFIKSRAYRFGVKIPYPYPMTFDTKNAFKRTKFLTIDNGFGSPTASLDMVIDFFRFSQQKTKLYPNRHADALIGITKKERLAAMEEMVAHCVADCQMTAKIFHELMKHDPKPVFKRFA